MGAELADLQERLFAERTAGLGAQRAARAAGHGHLRQGRRAAAHGRARRPAGRADHLVQGARPRRSAATTSSGGSASALPGAGHDRRLRPLALRGRADRPGARAGAEPERDRAPLRRDQRLRGASWSTAAPTIVKCMLHISADEQKERLLARLDDPTKHWKYNPGDIDERGAVADLPARPTRSPWSAPTPSVAPVVRRSPATGSGSATSPSASCCSRRCAGWTRSGRRPTSTSRRSSADWRERGARSRDPDRRGHPLRHPAARGRHRCPGSSRPTTSAPTSASSAAPARACGCWWPRSIVGELARRIGLRTPRLVGARPRPRDRPLRGRRGGPGPAQRQPRAQPRRRLPARAPSATTATCRRRPGGGAAAGAVARRVHAPTSTGRWRNPNLLVWHGDLWVIDHGAASTSTTRWAGGVTRPGAVRRAALGPDATTSCAGGRARVPAVDAEAARPPRSRASSARSLAEVPDAWLEPVPGAESPDGAARGVRRLPRPPASAAAPVAARGWRR